MLVYFILNASFLNKKHNILCIMFRCFRQVRMYHLHLNILSSINLLQTCLPQASITVLPSSRNVPSAPKFKPQSGVIFVENKLSSNFKVQRTETLYS